MIEYKGTAKEYAYNYLKACENATKLKHVQAYVVRNLAAERNWEYREDPKVEDEIFPWRTKPHGYKTCCYGGYDYKTKNNESILVLLYCPKEHVAGLPYEAVIFHWNSERSYCHVFVCPVYSPKEDPSGYYEGKSISWETTNECIYCYVRDKYANSADINDHDHYFVEAGFVYDTSTKTLNYYIPE
ncbi:MAG: hypothetical protein IKU45_03250 [Clostridia bacterium]|nr:hypothetical protein [Clostridia bacterium]